jgi:hypothetical protein
MGRAMNDGTAFQKRRKLLEMLDEGLVMVHLDPRPEGVIVPPWLKSDPVLRLNLAYGFRLPALDVGPEGVYAVLSFNKQNFGCSLPWSAIFALTFPDQGHEGRVWAESLPPELAAEVARREAELGPMDDEALPEGDEAEPASAELAPAPARAEASPPRPPAIAEAHEPKPAPPPLFLVHEGGGDAAVPTGERKRPNLRLVKG